MKPTRINDKWELKLFPDRHDFHTERPDWEAPRLQHMHDKIKDMDNPILVDVGAEEGDLSVLYASWGAQVVCVEAAPLYWKRIRETFEANDLSPYACWQVLASHMDKDTKYPTVAYPQDEGFRHLNEHDEITPQIRLDTLCLMGDHMPDIVMIDVEGAEYRVLEGAEKILNHIQPLVYVSVHPEIMKDRYKTSTKKLHRLMGEAGYEGIMLDDDHEQDWFFEPKKESEIIT